MMISTNYKRDDFACSCGCGYKSVDVELIQILERCNIYFGKVAVIHCACRCLEHNRLLGSKDTSQHVKGMAVDFHYEGIDPEEVRDYIRDRMLIDRGGIGIYNKWKNKGLHVDVRDKKADWTD